MLTRVRVRNFKRFDDVDIELGEAVVLVGPNNSGKTSALQALALWQLARDRWLDVRGEGEAPKVRPGITVNRRDLIATPVPETALLWRGRKVQKSRGAGGKATDWVAIEVVVEGADARGAWTCGFEIVYDNEESFRCKLAAGTTAVPAAAKDVHIAFLPPMAGLGSTETRIDRGAIDVRIGEGRTSEVLRNLCHLVSEDPAAWTRVTSRMKRLFNVDLDRPLYVPARGEITMGYADEGIHLDLSSAGRGMQQTLLLLAYMEATPRAVFLLDEPDAHLENLRQREIYGELTRAVRESGSQLVAATHSEVIMNEAGDRDVLIAFVGRPHRIDDRGPRLQARKALISIGAEHYYQAQRIGWVLYLEGATDLAILQALAETLEHPARELLQRPYVHYVMNQPGNARDHFYGLREAKPDLVGLALFDHLDTPMSPNDALHEQMWSRREIESYIAQPATLLAYARKEAESSSFGPLFDETIRERNGAAMRTAIARRVPPAALEDLADPYWHRTKVSDELLAPVFSDYYRALGLPNLMNKSDYHVLASLLSRDAIDSEVGEVLDRMVAVAKRAAPLRP